MSVHLELAELDKTPDAPREGVSKIDTWVRRDLSGRFLDVLDGWTFGLHLVAFGMDLMHFHRDIHI